MDWMKKKINGVRLERVVICAAFVLCILLTAAYLILGYGAYLDSDMASELALAQHLVKKGTLISRTWRYSTEVRVLNTQLVFTPLMKLLGDNWRLVRTLGCMIVLGLLAGSSYFCSRKLGADRRYALLFSGLSVIPYSVVYAQMIVIGAYYVPHAILTNLLIGWTAGWARGGKRIRALILLLLAFVMGASSIRYLFCAALPVAAAGIWMWIFGDAKKRPNECTRLMGMAIVVCAISCVGYAAGQKLIGMYCLSGSGRYGASRLVPLSGVNLFEVLDQAFDGLVKLLGYREERELFSLQGMLSIGALLLIPLAVMLAVRTIRMAREDGNWVVCFGALAFLLAAGLTLGTFVFVEGLYLNRYWIPVVTLGMTAMAMCVSKERNGVLKRMAALMFAVILLGTSLVQVRDTMASPEIGEDDWERAAYLKSSGFVLGYATFWNANVMTELTDGAVEVVSMRIETNEQGDSVPALDVWLEDEENTRESRPQEGVFLLLDDQEAEQLSGFLALCGAREMVLPGNGMRFFTVESQSRFFEAMDAPGM